MRIRLLVAIASLLVWQAAPSTVLAGSASAYGLASPSADFAVDNCQSEINALPRDVSDNRIRSDLPKLLNFGADELEGYLPQIDGQVGILRGAGREVEAKTAVLGGCLARAIIASKRGVPMRRPAAPQPAPAPSHGGPSEFAAPKDAAMAAASAAVDEVLGEKEPDEPRKEKKKKVGINRSDCVDFVPNTEREDIVGRLVNRCGVTVEAGWWIMHASGNITQGMQTVPKDDYWVIHDIKQGKGQPKVEWGACEGKNTFLRSLGKEREFSCSPPP